MDQDQISYETPSLSDLLQHVVAGYDLYATTLRERLGLSANEQRVLLQLFAHGPLTSADLARRIGITTASMTAIVAGLERKHFIRRVRDRSDKRKMFLYLTKQAVRTNLAATAALENDLQERTAELPPRVRGAVEGFLRDVAGLLYLHGGS